MKIGIVGKGNVGTALSKGLEGKGHEIRFGLREPRGSVVDVAKWSDVVILAVPWTAHKDVAKEAGTALDGKPVVDVSNVLTPSLELAIGHTTSGAEELQKLLPNALIVKAFNTIFAGNMSSGRLHDGCLTVFMAGNDARSKEIVGRIAGDIGFDVVDAGPLKSARYLEPMGMLNITLGYGLKMGTDIGFTLVKKTAVAVKWSKAA